MEETIKMYLQYNMQKKTDISFAVKGKCQSC